MAARSNQPVTLIPRSADHAVVGDRRVAVDDWPLANLFMSDGTKSCPVRRLLVIAPKPMSTVGRVAVVVLDVSQGVTLPLPFGPLWLAGLARRRRDRRVVGR